MPVLDPGKGRTKTGYFWTLARDDRSWGGDAPPGVVYFYAPGRGGENAEKFLKGFDGILQLDGYQGYNRLLRPSRKGGDPIQAAYCWAHARRKLKEVFDRDKSGIAAEGLRRIAEFYEIEAQIRGCSPAARLSVRKERTAPLVAAFGTWLQEQRLQVSKKSRLGEKLNYISKHWDGLQLFLTDGRIEIDSNKVENLQRPVALGRKNALFACRKACNFYPLTGRSASKSCPSLWLKPPSLSSNSTGGLNGDVMRGNDRESSSPALQ